MSTRAVLLATSQGLDGEPTALYAPGGQPLISRMLAQLGALGVDQVTLLTRPADAERLRAIAPPQVDIAPSRGPSEDLAMIADIARQGADTLVLASAGMVTHGEALAGLLADPRIVSGALVTTSWVRGEFEPRLRQVRARIASAGSPYHLVGRPNAFFLQVLKVDGRDLRALTGEAERLAPLVADPPARWADGLAAAAADWRRRYWREDREAELRRLGAPVERARKQSSHEAYAVDAADLRFDDAREELIEFHRRAADDDAVLSLLLVALVRAGVPMATSYLRELYWSRPVTADAAARAVGELDRFDEDAVLLASAVKGSDGFFTTFFVSPYSKYLARWGARHGLRPNEVTVASMVVGALAAACFGVGHRWGLIAGAVLFQFAFTLDCVDGQLARYTRQFSKLGGWLDSVFDRGKEYLAYTGLAIGAARGWHDDVWVLAVVAMAMQTTRHMVDFSYAATQHRAIATTEHLPLAQPEDTALAFDVGDATVRSSAAGGSAGTAVAVRSVGTRAIGLAMEADRLAGAYWAKRIIVLPIGERWALISLTAAVFSPRITFLSLIAWGGLAATYSIGGRALRSAAAR